MAYNWREYVELAEELLNRSEDSDWEEVHEACYRTIISRAYYGVYGTAYQLVSCDGYRLQKSGLDHQLVCNYLFNHSNGERRKVGFFLKQLHPMRIVADYANDIKIDRTVAVKMVVAAQSALEYLDQCDTVHSLCSGVSRE